ncbi:MAG: hypothetical protein GY715_02260 [Planctomycetes bacterium]|nr:hypothetical protein [Planctomycetota bacterium]
MTGNQYLLLGYAVSIGLLWGYALSLWLTSRALTRQAERSSQSSENGASR